VINTLSDTKIIHIPRSEKQPVSNVKWKVLELIWKSVKFLFRDNDPAIYQHYGAYKDGLSREYAISTGASLSNFKAGVNPIRTSRLRPSWRLLRAMNGKLWNDYLRGGCHASSKSLRISVGRAVLRKRPLVADYSAHSEAFLTKNSGLSLTIRRRTIKQPSFYICSYYSTALLQNAPSSPLR
jgi:hypothetical protein